MSRRSLASNVMALYAIQGMQYVFPLLVLPVITRAIGPDRYGELSFWQALAALLGLVVEYGFNYTSIRAVNQAESEDEKRTIFWSTAWAKIALLIVASAMLLATASAISTRATPFLIFATWLPLLGSAISPAWYYVATRNNVSVAAISAGTSLFAVIAIWVTVKTPADFNRAALIQLSLPLIAGVTMLVHQRARMSPGRPEFAMGAIVSRLREGLPLFVVTLSAGAYSAFNPFLLGLVTSSHQVADYSLGERLVRAAKNGLQPILTVMYPYAAGGNRNSSTTRANLRRAAMATLAVSIAIALALAVSAPWAIWLISGTQFLGAVASTRILAINVVAITAGNLIGVQYLVAQGQERLVAAVTVVAAPLHVVAFMLSGHRFGASGGAVAYVFVECLVTLTLGFVALSIKKKLHTP